MAFWLSQSKNGILLSKNIGIFVKVNSFGNVVNKDAFDKEATTKVMAYILATKYPWERCKAGTTTTS